MKFVRVDVNDLMQQGYVCHRTGQNWPASTLVATSIPN